MRNMIPILVGNTNIRNEENLHFTNLDSPVGGAIINAVTDFYDGVRSGNIDNKIKINLKKQLYP